MFRQSYDNNRISLIFFFLAGLALQRWAAKQRGRWLLLSFVFFLLSVLTYENAAFLFPALLLLAWPLLPASKKDSVRSRALTFTGLAAGSGLILMITYFFYGFIAPKALVADPALSLNLGDLPTHIFGSGLAVYFRFGQFGIFETGTLNSLMAIGLLFILALSSIWIVRLFRGAGTKLTKETRLRWTCIYLASLWFLIFGPLPYVLLGYGVGGRIYSSAVFGVFALLLMVYETANKRLLRIMAIALILLFAWFGLLVVRNESILHNRGEAELNIFYRGLKDAVPYIRRHTVFIIINGPIGYEGCGASLEMLYNQSDLKCVLLNSNNSYYQAIRHPAEIEAAGQHLRGENWILIKVTDNVPGVLGELKPGDFDLLITWESTEPIRTDTYKLLLPNETKLPPPSAFYLDLLQRAKVLFPQ